MGHPGAHDQPNFLHEEAVAAVEKAGVFGGYLVDLAYTPKSLKAVKAVRDGALGHVTWVRSRETHPGAALGVVLGRAADRRWADHRPGLPLHRDHPQLRRQGNRPIEVMCHTDTLVHAIADEDNATALIRFESGAIGQFEVSWTFRGGMDLRDEVAGTHVAAPPRASRRRPSRTKARSSSSARPCPTAG